MIIDHPSATPPTYECLYQEANRQSIPPELILAVMKTEGGKLGQFQKNTNGSYDIGPMQINSTWIPKLAKKLNESTSRVEFTLAYNGCWNMAVGAWILRDAINEAYQKSGGKVISVREIWQGVAWYNSHTPKYGTPYAWRVHGNLKKILAAAGKKSLTVAAVEAVKPVETQTGYFSISQTQTASAN